MEKSIVAHNNVDLWETPAHRLMELLEKSEKPPKSSIEIFNSSNVHLLRSENLSLPSHYLDIVAQGTQFYIDNIAAEQVLLRVGNQLIPILIAENVYTNSYVCSPHAHYVSLALESPHLFQNWFIQKGVLTGLKILGGILKSGNINKVAYVNHSFFSTDLQINDLDSCNINRIVAFLTERYPEHAIAFRSLNQRTTPKLMNTLKMCGFDFLMSKYVYVTNPHDETLFQTRIVKSDMKIWNESDYKIITNNDIYNNHLETVLNLYQSLSIDDHSSYNPRINRNFLELLLNKSHMQFFALEKDGKIDGVMGYVKENNILMCPFFGYDKRHPDRNKLYRLMSTFLLLEAKSQKAIFHQSSGASFYKKIRRAVGHQEYLGIYTKHLPKKSRVVWSILKNVINTSAQSFMKKY